MIAIYGGSFDPVHLAHVMVVTHILLNEPDIDEIYVVPCFQQGGKTLSHFDDRIAMLEASFGHLPIVTLSKVEKDLGGESVTSRTIKAFREKYPNEKLRFVMGADLIESAKKWSGWDYIEREAPPLIVGRAGINSQATPIIPAVSSTMIRDMFIADDKRYKRYVASRVSWHMENTNLYKPQRILYYGCNKEPGHFFHTTDCQVRYDKIEQPWKNLDGGIQPGKSVANGIVKLTQEHGWSAISWWDNSVDDRPGSHSTFIAKENHSAEAMLKSARANYPWVFSRFKYTVEIK